MTLREDRYSSSSSLEGKKKKGGCNFRRQNKNKKTPTTVAPIKPQQRAPDNHLPQTDGFCRLRFSKDHQADECHVILLQVRVVLLQQWGNNKSSLPQRGIGRQLGDESPYYRNPVSSS